MSLNPNSPLKPKVVMIDDYEANLLALEVSLRDLSCEIVKFGTGKMALEYLAENEVAVILLDIKMPIIDGFEVARKVRQMPVSQSTPIVFITSYDDTQEQLRKAYEAGGTDYIFKPIDEEALAAKVSKFLDVFHSRRNREAQLPT